MLTVTLQLVTIIAERFLKDQLINELRTLGATGYTLTDAEGEGSRGVRASEWEGRNVKIEVIVSDEVAEAITDHVADHYFEHYAVVLYSHPVEVVRSSKYR
jgi:nitrogen regulatory protein PII